MEKSTFSDERVLKLLKFSSGPTISVKKIIEANWASVKIIEHNIQGKDVEVDLTDQEVRWLIPVLSGWLDEVELVRSISEIK